MWVCISVSHFWLSICKLSDNGGLYHWNFCWYKLISSPCEIKTQSHTGLWICCSPAFFQHMHKFSCECLIIRCRVCLPRFSSINVWTLWWWTKVLQTRVPLTTEWQILYLSFELSYMCRCGDQCARWAGLESSERAWPTTWGGGASRRGVP